MEDHTIMVAREEALRQAVAVAIRYADRQMMPPSEIVKAAEAFEEFLTRAPKG